VTAVTARASRDNGITGRLPSLCPPPVASAGPASA
jgi:hypothetical protein